MSDSLQPHALQHARLPCPLFPKVCSGSCPLSRWCYLTIASTDALFSFCLLSFPTSRSFPMSWLKYWSFSFSISPSNEYSRLISFRIDWLDLLAVQGTSRVFSSTTIQRHQFLSSQPSLWSTLTSIHDYWKTHIFEYTDLCWPSNVSAF